MQPVRLEERQVSRHSLYVRAWLRRMLAVIALRRCMSHSMCVCVCARIRCMMASFFARWCMYVPKAVSMNKAYASFLLAMQYKAHGHGDCCEAMHSCVGVCVRACAGCMLAVIAARLCMMCGSMCLGVYRAYAHSRFCEAMHACVNVCLRACTWRMVTVIAARQCMRVLVCVFLCTMRMVTVIAVRRCMRVCLFVCSCAQCAWSLWLLRGDACVCGMCVWACARRMLTVLFGRPCTYVSECMLLINWSAERVNQSTVWSTKYQPWWANIWLPFFCDAATSSAVGAPGKQTSCFCSCLALCVHTNTRLCAWILEGLWCILFREAD